MGRATEFIERTYGFPCETIERAVVLNAAAPVVVLQNDPNRVAWTIFNLGVALGYVAFTNVVGPLFGIQLGAVGGVAGSNAREDGELPARALWGIGAGATTLYVIETRAMR